MRSLYLKAVNHIISLGFSRDHAESIAGMDLDGLDGREAHYEFILECDQRDIINWIGIRPEGGTA